MKLAGARRRLWIGLAAVVVLTTLIWGVAGLSGAGREVPLLTVERATFRHRVVAEGHLQAAESTPIVVPSAVRRPYQIAWLATEGRQVEAGEVVLRFDPTQLEETSAEARADFQTSELEITKQEVTGRAAVRNLERDADLAEGELDQARSFAKHDEEVFSRFEIIESEVDAELAAERERHAETELASRTALSQTELDLLAIARRQAQAKIDRATKALELLEVEAPHAGLFLLERNWRGEPPRTGDTVYSGQKLAEIPDLAEMEAEVFILEADAGGLAEGLPARVAIESRPHATHAATIRRVDTLAKPRIPASPVQYFAVILELEQTDAEIMKPGQRVTAEIVTAEVEDALVIPRQAVFEDEGRHYALRKTLRGFERVEVTVGETGLGKVVVSGDLEPGDVIAASDPKRAPEGLLGEARGAGGPGSGGR